MSRLHAIAKNLSARVISQAVGVVQQVGLVPVFIHAYGTQVYGEWLAISAAVQYLGTLDFGVQTFVNQDLTIRYQGGNMGEFHVQQSTALRLLLSIVAVAAILCSAAFLLPLQRWLKLDGSDGAPVVPSLAVSLTIFLLATQVLVGLLFNYFNGTFMVLGRAHIGAYWSITQRSLVLGASIFLVFFRTSFVMLALSQLCIFLLCLLGVITHLRYAAPQISPTLRYWDAKSVAEILRKSGSFALIYSSNFLVYQLPVLIMQRSLGPAAVVAFTVMRTMFSMPRQILSAFAQSMGPEITNLFAVSDWKGLLKLYDYSERLIFACIPVVNIGTLLLSPLLLSLWLHKPSLFIPTLYAIAAAISIVTSTKEHKYTFQVSTNTHVELGRIMFFSYLALAVISLFTVPRFGVQGFLWPLLATECVQLTSVIGLNQLMFSGVAKVALQPLYRLIAFSAVALTLTTVALPHLSTLPPLEQASCGVCLSSALFGIAWPLFSLSQPAQGLLKRLRGAELSLAV
jgi:O-antigen/teichoic acid export membrane protein